MWERSSGFSGWSGNCGMRADLWGTHRNDFRNECPICLAGDFCNTKYRTITSLSLPLLQNNPSCKAILIHLYKYCICWDAGWLLSASFWIFYPDNFTFTLWTCHNAFKFILEVLTMQLRNVYHCLAYRNKDKSLNITLYYDLLKMGHPHEDPIGHVNTQCIKAQLGQGVRILALFMTWWLFIVQTQGHSVNHSSSFSLFMTHIVGY